MLSSKFGATGAEGRSKKPSTPVADCDPGLVGLKMNVNKNKKQETFYCETCTKVFKSQSALYGHSRACAKKGKAISKRFVAKPYNKNGHRYFRQPKSPPPEDPKLPNLLEAFTKYDELFFNSQLQTGGQIDVSWESWEKNGSWAKTAGVTLPRHTNRNVKIKIVLNSFLLAGRSEEDIHSTLVHEMIHAELKLSKKRRSDSERWSWRQF